MHLCSTTNSSFKFVLHCYTHTVWVWESTSKEIIPNILRVFTASEKYAEFKKSGPNIFDHGLFPKTLFCDKKMCRFGLEIALWLSFVAKVQFSTQKQHSFCHKHAGFFKRPRLIKCLDHFFRIIRFWCQNHFWNVWDDLFLGWFSNSHTVHLAVHSARPIFSSRQINNSIGSRDSVIE
jgi:hypothetical protein